tara:strand:- start:285 stop:878 length:594 start_codon:yes stop_codon:yes gene_type:complete
MKKQLTAWLSIGSTYTYLTALRLEKVISRYDVEILVKPISIRSIMKEMDNTPFPPSKPEKVQYMWRDIERRAAVHGLPTPKVPAPYPLKHFDRANLFGVVMAKEGLYVDYLRETYLSWFLDGNEAGGAKNLKQCCCRLQLNYEAMLTAADSPEVKNIFEKNTKEARQFGIFGVPSFSINGEVFWGDDRLEDAILFQP